MGYAIEKLDMTNTGKKFDLMILGMGKTGLSCLKYFSNRNKSIAMMDSREFPPELDSIKKGYPDIPLYLGKFDQEKICMAELLIVSPGISVNEPSIKTARECGIKIFGDIEVFCNNVSRPVLAVTGSNGKSTVASLISDMIENSGRQVKLGGNIGTPALDLISQDEPDYYVLELSSFQLETTESLNAIASVILNISEDHMDRYSGIESYTAAKKKIYTGTGTMVINLDDDLVSAMVTSDRKYICYTTRDNPRENTFYLTRNNGSIFITYANQQLLDINSLSLSGRHNVSNCMAALALGTAIGLPVAAMLTVLQKFQGLPHRCQWVTNLGGVDWYNDSKATNVGACRAAIEGLAGDNNIILIAGGQGKGADFSRLSEVCNGKVRAAVMIGADAGLLANAIQDSVEIYNSIDMVSAVALAHQLSRPGDIVLLSPACASLDMFDDYKHRGQVFINAVERLNRQ